MAKKRNPEKVFDATQAIVRANMRALRLLRGMSQRELAELMDCSQPFIANLEGGKSSISLHTLCWIATCLETKPDLLLRKDAFH